MRGVRAYVLQTFRVYIYSQSQDYTGERGRGGRRGEGGRRRGEGRRGRGGGSGGREGEEERVGWRDGERDIDRGLARSSFREMSQTVRIDWKYHGLSWVRISVWPSNFFIRKKHQQLSRIPSCPHQCLVEWSNDRPFFSGHGRSIASDNVGLLERRQTRSCRA